MSWSIPFQQVVNNVSASAGQVQVNQPVTIYANVANRGDVPGTYKAILKVNGQVEEIKTGTISGHVAVPLKFDIVRDMPGVYTVDIDGQQTSFTVIGDSSSADEPVSVPLIGFILCAVGVVVVSTLLVLGRRSS